MKKLLISGILLLLIFLVACTKEEANCREDIVGTYEEVTGNPRSILEIREGQGNKGLTIVWFRKDNAGQTTLMDTLTATLSENCTIIDIPYQTTTNNHSYEEGILSVSNGRILGKIEGFHGFITEDIDAIKR